MDKITFCAIIPHRQITKMARDKFDPKNIQELVLLTKGKHQNSGLVDILEFTDEHLTQWQKSSKGLDKSQKINLAERMFKTFRSR